MGLKEKGRGGIYGGGGKKGELGGDKPRRDKDGGANRRGVNIARARRDENKSTVREQRATENQQPSKNEREKKKETSAFPSHNFTKRIALGALTRPPPGWTLGLTAPS